MSKKKKYSYDSIDICEAIEEYYMEDNEEISQTNTLITKLPSLVDANKACKISEVESVYVTDAAMYRVASKFIQKYNKKLSKFRRSLRRFEFGNKDSISSKNNPELIKLTRYVLEDGKYFAQLDDNNYCILIISTNTENYDNRIATDLYFIGDKYKKWRKKYLNYQEKYKSLTTIQKNEQIQFSNNSRTINTMFKPFEQLIIKDKKSILRYIDNWYKSIPTYYNKYKMIPKLSIMLEGPPGTGKSSFYKALANYLDISDVMVMCQDYFDNPNKQDSRYISYSMRGSYGATIYAIDDIDCVCESRDSKKNDKDNSSTLSNLLAFLDNPPTFDIKAEDGIMYPVSIVVATTNHYDKLDPAVRRYGRFDKTITMGNFDRKYAQEMCDIYGLKLEDLVTGSDKKNFEIAPSKLQAICLRNIDNSLKNNQELEKVDGLVKLHRR